jgi:hypothetical protein
MIAVGAAAWGLSKISEFGAENCQIRLFDANKETILALNRCFGILIEKAFTLVTRLANHPGWSLVSKRMSVVRQIEFVLQDRVEGVEITPATIGLARFNEFNPQVETFIAWAEKLKVDDVNVRMAEGSYIEDYSPGYDEAALDRFAEAGKKAWADVPDAAAWVRELRGGAL